MPSGLSYLRLQTGVVQFKKNLRYCDLSWIVGAGVVFNVFKAWSIY